MITQGIDAGTGETVGLDAAGTKARSAQADTPKSLNSPTTTQGEALEALKEWLHKDTPSYPMGPIALRSAIIAALQPNIDHAVGGVLRPEVLAFAHLMERQLRANDHKGGWKDDLSDDLFARVKDEVEELECALFRHHKRVDWGNGWLQEDTVPRVASEAADVANFAMMIADVCGALAPASTPPVNQDAVREALEKCGDQFAFYAREHFAAGKTEKGKTNLRFANLAAEALATPPLDNTGLDAATMERCAELAHRHGEGLLEAARLDRRDEFIRGEIYASTAIATTIRALASGDRS